MQRNELEQQQEVIVAKLRLFPRLRLVSSKMNASDWENSFFIQDSFSGMRFRIPLKGIVHLSSKLFERWFDAKLKQILWVCDNTPSATGECTPYTTVDDSAI